MRSPVIVAAAVAGEVVLAIVLPALIMPWVAAIAAGVLLIAAGAALAGWAIRTLIKSGGSPDPRIADPGLVESGPFKFSRNPIYVAYVALVAGAGLAANALWTSLIASVAAALIRFTAIRREEVYLRLRFGGPYKAYRARVRRWL